MYIDLEEWTLKMLSKIYVVSSKFHQAIKFIPNNVDLWYYLQDEYRLLLLEIVGLTSTKMIFFYCICLCTIREDEYFWMVLNKFKWLFVKDDVLPWVIVIDRDLALMNALEVVFPSSTNLLCEFHISKNVKAKCKILVTKAEGWEIVMDAW